jgi:hypothetical protein
MSEARIRDWRMRAEELRVVAESMEDPLARRGMLNAAATYQAMADEAEAASRATTASGR